MTARELLNKRIRELVEGDFHSLVAPVRELAAALGDVELTNETERFLTWFMNWDGSSLTGLAALINDRDRARSARAPRPIDGGTT